MHKREMAEARASERGIDRSVDEKGHRNRRRPLKSEPRWPALLALLALGGLYAALPTALLVGGPRWLLLLVVSLLLVPAIVAQIRGDYSFSGDGLHSEQRGHRHFDLVTYAADHCITRSHNNSTTTGTCRRDALGVEDSCLCRMVLAIGRGRAT